METISELWRRIETSLAFRVPEGWERLASGASEDDIQRMEDTLGVPLPQEVRESYRLHDGGFRIALVTTMKVLPLREVVKSWQVLEELLHDEEWAQQPPYYFTDEVVQSGWQVGPIQPAWWHRCWIPLGADNAGNLTCLDMAPAPGGIEGQVIDWDHECGPSRVLFRDFRHLLSALADGLESGTNEQTD